MIEENAIQKSTEEAPPAGMKLIPLFDSPEALSRWILEQKEATKK